MNFEHDSNISLIELHFVFKDQFVDLPTFLEFSAKSKCIDD